MRNPYGLGYIPDPPDVRDFQLLSLLPPLMVPLPIKYSYREHMTPVRNQYNLGACCAFAALSVKEYFDSKEYAKEIDLSEQWLYAKCKEIDGYPGEGTYLRAAADVLLKSGACEEKFWPYEARHPAAKNPLSGADLNAQQYKITSYAYVPAYLASVKTALYQNGPLIVGVEVKQNFYNIGTNGIIPKPAGSMLGGHAMCVVGYDDDKQMLEIKNSWGEGFGDKGYVWLPYAYFDEMVLGPLNSYVDMVGFHKHWKDWPDEALVEQDIVFRKGIFEGYPDGTIRPWEPLTKRHVALVQHRLGRYVKQKFFNDYSIASRKWVQDSFPYFQWNKEDWEEPITRFQFINLLAREIVSQKPNL